MKFGKHCGLVKSFNELRFKFWLDNNAYKLLESLNVKPGQTILDFGCGKGTYSIPASYMVGETGVVYILDISSTALDKVEEKAKKRGLKNIIRIKSKGDVKISLEDESIDHLFFIDVLQEIEDKDMLFDEAYRILNISGFMTVFPMHIKDKEIINLSEDKGFYLADKKFDDRILVFKKK